MIMGFSMVFIIGCCLHPQEPAVPVKGWRRYELCRLLAIVTSLQVVEDSHDAPNRKMVFIWDGLPMDRSDWAVMQC